MIDDEWTNAIMALIASTEPDTKLLAMWLRSEKPIPPGIRDALAELLNPGEPPLYNVRLTPEFIWTPNKEAVFFEKWIAVGLYDRLRAKGMSEENALKAAGKIFTREKSVVHKGRKFIHTFIPKLLKRIRHG
jgi:hypothetical protein